jgi:DNA-binding NarL/FixJ family response regulator
MTGASGPVRGKMAEAQCIRVAIIEDDRSIREGLALLIGGSPGYSCVGTFSSVEEAMAASRSPEPDVFLLDIHLPGVPGSDGVRLLKQKHPTAQVVMLTIYGDQDRIFESICNGACGYLLKKTPPAKLLESIREAHDGGAPMSPEVARKVVELFQATGPPARAEQELTPQEVRLLGLLAEGYSYQGCANRLKISVNTVRNYIRSIYEKLHVHTKSEAVSKALRSRLIH